MMCYDLRMNKLKPWQINTIIIGAFLLLLFSVPLEEARALSMGVWIASAVWVYLDAQRLEIGKYRGSFWGTGPLSRAIIVWILWIIAFPLYISFRSKVIAGAIPLKEAH